MHESTGGFYTDTQMSGKSLIATDCILGLHNVPPSLVKIADEETVVRADHPLQLLPSVEVASWMIYDLIALVIAGYTYFTLTPRLYHTRVLLF